MTTLHESTMPIIRAFGKAAHAKLKALIELPRSEVKYIKPERIKQINRIAHLLAKGVKK